MKTKIEFKEREFGGKVEIILPDGNMYRITFEDKEKIIRIQTIDGRMIILPSVSNEIRISTSEQ
jgi:hypothetical protein